MDDPSVDDPLLISLLLEFEESVRIGRPIAASRLAALVEVVTKLLVGEFCTHGDEILVRNRHTCHITWEKADRASRARPHRSGIVPFENIEWIDSLRITLDRMLVHGVRRRANTNAPPPPRLAERVQIALEGNGTITDPHALIVDCLKHAIYDEVRTSGRRMTSTAAPRVPKKVHARKRDASALLRGEYQLLLDAIVRNSPAELEPSLLASVIAYEYQGGGFDRARVDAFASLPLGNATLGVVLDAIDRSMRAIDDASAAADRGSTRRKLARVKGIGAKRFASILQEIELPVSADSLPKSFGRKREALLEALRRCCPNSGGLPC